MSKYKVYFFFTVVFSIGSVAAAVAQQDSSKRRTIDITSTFKPVLRDPSKLNFQASPVVADTSRPRLSYNIPGENLLFAYQPAELKPLSLETDSSSVWPYSNFIKVGFGNVHQPYLKAGFSFGDGEKTFLNIFADHYTSKGDLQFQKNSLSRVGAALTYKTPKNLEWNAGLGISSDDYFLYGFRPDSLSFTKDQLRQRFQTVEGKVNMRNIVPTEFGLSYNPSARVSVFRDNREPRGTEANTVVTLPIQKNFGKSTAFMLSASADLTSYRNEANTKKTEINNIYMISPAVLLKTPNLFLQAGIIPSWDQSEFHLLPNAMADITTNDKRFTLQLGWIGYYNKGSYQRFASINPWLAQPDSLLNTRVQEGYVGFKGSIADHFSYSAKVGYQQHKNMPLFVNDMGDGKTFVTLFEDKLNMIQTHAEAEYRMGEKFSAKGVFNWNIFKIEEYDKPWGLIPIELTTSVRWQMLRDLFLRVDLWTWDGARYRTKEGDSFKGEGAFDLNAGAEFRVYRNFSVWLQMNNILNNRYERWNQYESFGFNILGGIVYSFNQ